MIGALLPEAVLVVGAVAALAWGRAVPGVARATGAVAIGVGALATAAVLAFGELVRPPAGDVVARACAYLGLLVDGHASALRAMLAAATAIALAAAIPAAGDVPRDRRATPREVALVIVGTLGANVLVLAATLGVVYLAAELIGIVSVALAATAPRDGRRVAPPLELAVRSAVASGLTLFGVSWLYAATGALSYGPLGEGIATLTRDAGQVPERVFGGVVLVVVGLGAKLFALPLDAPARLASRRAPIVVTAFFSLAGVAAVGALARFAGVVLRVGGPEPLLAKAPWHAMIALFGGAMLVSGGLGALRARTPRAVLASIGLANLGAALSVLAIASPAGRAAALFQLAVSSMAVAAGFAVLGAASGARGDGAEAAALTRLGVRSPPLALAFVLALASLSSLPPLAGFAARLELVRALLAERGAFANGAALLAVAVACASTLVAAAGARLVRAIYFTTDAAEAGEAAHVSPRRAWVALALALPSVVVGLAPRSVYDLLVGGVVLPP